MTQIHLISHTHWDREWYLPFETFRLRLVALIDHLFEILTTDPDFHFFMLDGQTIVLDDYLEFRPERKDLLKQYIQSGRILIGPWHVLPDEFIVSPEAIVRNLLQGDRTSRHFGKNMPVGYIPDPFGHIGQMPQILRGFGIDSAAFQRGACLDTTEFIWEAPDGSRVFTSYLRNGYANAAYFSTQDPDRCVTQLNSFRDSLLPYAQSPNLLLLFGTDHMEPSPQTSQAIRWFNERNPQDHMIHSNLPDYLASVRASIAQTGRELPVIQGEMRSPQRFPMLPGVLSARMWIKQRNHACENLLEKWIEPFSSFAQIVEDREKPSISERLDHPQEIIRQTWRKLMENHPHDSICGCSVDQVHDEMALRFDQVEQISTELVRQNLQFIANRVDTTAHPESACSLVIFNPNPFSVTEAIVATLQLPSEVEQFAIVDEACQTIDYQLIEGQRVEITRLEFNKETLSQSIGLLGNGEINGFVLEGFSVEKTGPSCKIQLVMKDRGKPDQECLNRVIKSVQVALLDPEIQAYTVQLVSPNNAKIRLLCEDIPGVGYRTYWVKPVSAPAERNQPVSRGQRIENEYFTVESSSADGSLTVLDKRSGITYRGLNRFVDGGDGGDEYNYCPPATDRSVTPEVVHIETNTEGAFAEMRLSLNMAVPASLSADRHRRSDETLPLGIETTIRLARGIPRIDIHTQVDNPCADHRLRVHFPAPIRTDHAFFDGHFQVVSRPIGVPPSDASWAERPRPEQPQRAFTAIQENGAGLMVANRGLPEVVALSSENDTEIALTLLRCVGWLSRDDLPCRPGHAGPGYLTPGAQMKGVWSFDYAIIPFTGAWETAVPLAVSFDALPRLAVTSIHAGSLPPIHDFLAAKPASFRISSMKWAEDGSGFIIRGYNIGPDLISIDLMPGFEYQSAVQVRLDESEDTRLSPQADGSLRMPCKPGEIVSIKLVFSLSQR